MPHPVSPPSFLQGANLLQYIPVACRFLDATLGGSGTAGSGGRPAATRGDSSGGDDDDGADDDGHEDAPPGGSGSAAGEEGAAGGMSGGDAAGAGALARLVDPSRGRAGAGVAPRVLVHCQAGMSRSPAVVVAWLMRR